MYLGSAISVGTVINKNGGGGGLTSSYTPGTIIATKGVGAIRLALTTTKDGATDERVRIMDYTDPANPRPIRSDDNADPPSSPAVEHIYAASTVTNLFSNLGGVVDAIAIEARTNGGAPTAGDTVSGDLTVFDGPVR